MASDRRDQRIVENLGLLEGSTLPVGVPVPWPLEIPPTGWLKCNGSTFLAGQYPELEKVYPSLILPDLRGEFIRGWSDGRDVDVGRTLLSSQNDLLKAHDHFFSQTWGATGFDKTSGAYPVGADVGGSVTNMRTIPTNSSGGIETRPRNIAFNYIVRAV
ncbi:phage tail protein [Xenorhabdus bovienii]|uniref:phage tail protein n=1 Tax=Xenorhabdus bovienii TaxID=40576 RepID=UPI0023B236DA|nr:phage tail protein [Xenorhabdus bovienii]